MIGVDEVGRGAWAGPLLVCAVRLKKSVNGLKDSKCLSCQQRQYLAKRIKQKADIGYGWVDNKVIDHIGLAKALKLGVCRALDKISPSQNEEIIIDGTINYVPALNSKAVVKADSSISCVSAASIVAKVARDQYMIKLAKQHPQYGFDKHVGYGTKQHIQALKINGLAAVHRRSYKLPF